MRRSTGAICCVLAASVLHTAEAFACNAGTYFDGVKCSRCPGGTFGAVAGLTSPSCSGLCTPGFFCPEGSTSSREKPCGTSIFYCPAGSAERRRVDEGYYTISFPTDQSNLPMVDSSLGGAGRQIRCEKGYYCVFGIRRVCPAAVFGDSTRLTTPACSAPCPKGSYCPEATNVPILCPAGTFGGEVGLMDARCSGLCPIGHYCEIGTITPAPCPAGTYGDVEGLISSACSSTCSSVSGVISCIPSPCPAGYYCPLATTVPLECGSTSIFCPKGSPVPTTATTGYHTTWKAYSGTSVTGEQLELQYVEGYSLAIQNQTTRSDQHICEKGSYCSGGVKKLCLAGTYGGSEGLSTVACTAPCPAGYYCPKGAADYTQYPCTSRTSFCRQGSSVPNAVDTGYYTVATQAELRTDEIVCPTGSYCIGGVQYFCPERTYGNTTGLASKACSGKCQNGFLCPQGSTSATQSPCPAGNYCIRGVKFLCPEGTYGATANLTSKACSGRCQDGYECPRGSTSPTQSQCSAGSYSRNAKMCAPCYPGNWCDITPPDCGADYAFCPL